MPRQSISQGHRGGLQLFQSGTIAMFIGGPQYLMQIEENAPSIYRSTDVAPAPVTGEAGKMALAVMALAVTTTPAERADGGGVSPRSSRTPRTSSNLRARSRSTPR
jgi:hypothetical protein